MPTKILNGVSVEMTPEEVAALPVDLSLEEQLTQIETQRIARIKAELDNQNSVNKVLIKISFLQENRIRVLEGRPEVTADQFRSWVEGQID